MNEALEYCNLKFEDLDSFIKSPANSQGIQGFFCRNGEFNRYYESKTRFNPDPRYFTWLDYIKEKYKKGAISIYKNSPTGKYLYLVLKGKEKVFLEAYPNGCPIVVDE
jgi:hypothetical protein